MARKKSSKTGKAQKQPRPAADNNAALAFIQNLMSLMPDDVRQELFESVSQAAFDEKPFASPPPGSKRTLNKVESLIDQARSQMTVREALPYAEQAVAVARQAVGKKYDKLVGRFGSDPKGYVYLDAKIELAQTMRAAGERDAALAHAEEVLRLDPTDPLDVRPLLLVSYLDVGRNTDARQMLREYCPEPWAAWLFGRLLVSLRCGERGEVAAMQLRMAHEQNPFVLSLLLSERTPDVDPPEFIEPGRDSEAQEYAFNSLPAWRETPGAISWLRETAGKLNLPIDPFPAAPRTRKLTARQFAAMPAHEVPEWVVGIHELPAVPASGEAKPRSKWLLFALDPESSFIETDLLDKKPTARDLWNHLVELMQDEEKPGRPEKLLVLSDKLGQQLQKDAARAGIELATYERAEELEQHLDQIFARMEGSAAALRTITPEAIRQAPLDPDEVWEAALVRLPQRVQVGGQSISVAVGLVMSRTSGMVLWHEIFTQSPPPEALESAVKLAIATPAMGDPRRPRQVIVRDPDEASSLRALSDEAGFTCEIQSQLDLIDSAVGSLAETVLGPPPPVVLTRIEGIAPADLERFYCAAAAFYRAQPWKCFRMDEVVGFDWGSARRFGVVMGQSGLTLGIAIYDRLRDLKAMFERDSDGDSSDGYSVIYGEEGDIPVADLDAVEQFGWPVAAPEAYPLAFRVLPGREVKTPTAEELRCLTGSLEGIVRLAQQPAEKETTIADGPTSVKLTRLGWIGSLADNQR